MKQVFLIRLWITRSDGWPIFALAFVVTELDTSIAPRILALVSLLMQDIFSRLSPLAQHSVI